MAFHFKNYKNSVLAFLAIFAFILLPDVIFNFINEAFQTGATSKNAIVAILIALFINFSASRVTTVVVLVMCFLMQVTQLAHFHSYGVFYSAHDIAQMFQAPHTVLPSVTDIFSLFLMPIIISFSFFLLALVVHLKFFKSTPKLPYLSVLFVVALLVPFLQALSSDAPQKFQPNSTHLAIKNSLYSLSYLAAKEVQTSLGVNQNSPEQPPL